MTYYNLVQKYRHIFLILPIIFLMLVSTFIIYQCIELEELFFRNYYLKIYENRTNSFRNFASPSTLLRDVPSVIYTYLFSTLFPIIKLKISLIAYECCKDSVFSLSNLEVSKTIVLRVEIFSNNGSMSTFFIKKDSIIFLKL